MPALGIVLLLASVSVDAQVVRGRAAAVASLPVVSLPLTAAAPSLAPGLAALTPSALTPMPSLAAPILSPAAHAVAAVAAVAAAPATPAIRAAAVEPAPLLRAAAVAAENSPAPAALPRMEGSASALFDGARARSAPAAEDPVFPGDEGPNNSRNDKPDTKSYRFRLSHPAAREPISPQHFEPGHFHGDGHDHPVPATPAHEKALKLAVAVSLFFIAVEFVGGLLTGSAALQADALHLLSDQVVNGAALLSAWLSRKPGGWPRVEAFVGLLAAGVIGWTGVEMGLEAYERFFVPGAAATWSVAAFALASLASNLSAALILRRHHGSSLGVKSAFLVAMTDTVGSIGVIVSAAAAILLGWSWAEPVVVALIGAMIVKIAWGLGKPAWKALFAGRRS